MQPTFLCDRPGLRSTIENTFLSPYVKTENNMTYTEKSDAFFFSFQFPVALELLVTGSLGRPIFFLVFDSIVPTLLPLIYTVYSRTMHNSSDMRKDVVALLERADTTWSQCSTSRASGTP